MRSAKEPFASARIERYTHSRRHAETAVETALLVCEAGVATDAQIADLADAVDALRARQYHVAVILAEAAIEGRSKTREFIRPTVMVRDIDQIRSTLAELRAVDR